jgi:hypothetical protein
MLGDNLSAADAEIIEGETVNILIAATAAKQDEKLTVIEFQTIFALFTSLTLFLTEGAAATAAAG